MAKQKTKEEKLKAVIDWINSPEGQKAITQSLKDADEFTAQMAEARKVPWQKMHEPMTI